MAEGDVLHDDAYVLRHVGSSKVEEGDVDGAAFVRKPIEEGLSFEWRNLRPEQDVDDQVDSVRNFIQRKIGRNDWFVELNVGIAQDYVQSEARFAIALETKHKPSPARDGWAEDPHHCEMFGCPSSENLMAALVGDLIAECVTALYRAKKETD